MLAYASVGEEDLMMRAFDGRVNAVTLANGTTIQSYLEKNEVAFKKYDQTQVVLVKLPDESVLKVNKHEMVLLGGHDRQAFQEPQEYFLQMFTVPSERK